MTKIRNSAILLLFGMLSACGSTPKPTYYSLAEVDARQAAMPARKASPSVAVLPISLPELIDRPQLVIHSGERQVRLLELQRWAEPLNREIPRLVAEDLGRLLDSSGIVALPADIQALAPDYRLRLDVQRLDAIEGVGVDVDVVWMLSARDSTAQTVRSGRTRFRQELQMTAPFPVMLIEAQRKAWQRVAGDIAEAVRASVAASAAGK